MKLFSELGCCCRPTGQRLETEESPKNCVQVVLVGSGDRSSCSMRKRMNGSKFWRPELSVILEDRVVSFLESDHHQDQGKANADRYDDKNEDIASYKSRSTAKRRR